MNLIEVLFISISIGLASEAIIQISLILFCIIINFLYDVFSIPDKILEFIRSKLSKLFANTRTRLTTSKQN